MSTYSDKDIIRIKKAALIVELEDGSVRVVNTDREIEYKMLALIIDNNGIITVGE